MADQFEVKMGTRIEPEEAKKLDRSKMGVSHPSPGEAEVEGQHFRRRLTICPWCYHAGWSWVNDHVYLWFTCHNCGRPFRA